MELWRGLFHNTSCWEMADPLFSRPTSLWARVPAVSTLRKHTSLPGYIFLSFRHWRLLWPFQLSPHRCSPALAASPLSSPFTTEPGRRRSCRCTARKHAAATIIALIARFFCWDEISGGATILLLNPQKPPSKDGGERVKKKKKKRHSGCVHQWDCQPTAEWPTPARSHPR